MRVGMWMLCAAAAALGTGGVPASAQMTTIDPNSAIDSDLQTPPPVENPTVPADPEPYRDAPPVQTAPAVITTQGAPAADARTQATDTFQHDDLIAAAEGVFGKGAEGLAGLIEDILKKQGEPNAYITGSEAGGAFVVGLRYGSGNMHHKVEGESKVYWRGPSVGFDFGGNAAKTFVLVYNLYDGEDLFTTYPAGEVAAYFVGGFNVSYLRRGDVVLIPVRLGAGVRLGANAGYMKFRKKGSWIPL